MLQLNIQQEESNGEITKSSNYIFANFRIKSLRIHRNLRSWDILQSSNAKILSSLKPLMFRSVRGTFLNSWSLIFVSFITSLSSSVIFELYFVSKNHIFRYYNKSYSKSFTRCCRNLLLRTIENTFADALLVIPPKKVHMLGDNAQIHDTKSVSEMYHLSDEN